MPKILTKLNIPSYASQSAYISAIGNPNAGDIFLNTTNDSIDVYTGTAFISLNSALTVVTYTPGSYTWTRPETVTVLDFVIAAGAGGGGAGGNLNTTTASTITVNGTCGGGSGATGYVQGIYVGNVSNISIAVASGGSGGAARTFTKATGVSTTSSQTANSGSSPSNTTVGSYITAGSGGGGTASVAGSAGSWSSTIYPTDSHNGDIASASPGTGVGIAGTGSYWYLNTVDPNYYLPKLSSTAATTGTRTVTGFSGSIAANGSVSSAQYIPGSGASSGGISTSSPSDGGVGIGGGGAGAASCTNNPNASSGASATVVTSNGGAGALGCGGGGGGSVAVYSATGGLTYYTNCTLNITSGAGGAGGDGFVIIAYQG